MEKSIYKTPQIECVKLDNEISLQLQSDAPVGPDESFSKAYEYLNNDPFKSNMG